MSKKKHIKGGSSVAVQLDEVISLLQQLVDQGKPKTLTTHTGAIEPGGGGNGSRVKKRPADAGDNPISSALKRMHDEVEALRLAAFKRPDGSGTTAVRTEVAPRGEDEDVETYIRRVNSQAIGPVVQREAERYGSVSPAARDAYAAHTARGADRYAG